MMAEHLLRVAFPSLQPSPFLPSTQALFPSIQPPSHNFSATQIDKKNFWVWDLHDGSRLDAPSLLSFLGHNITQLSAKGSLSPYPESFSKFHVPKVVAKTITSHNRHSQYLSEDEVIRLFKFYSASKDIVRADAFICMFPASLCEGWMPFNQTIIFLPAHRFLQGRCTIQRMNRLIEHLQRMAESVAPKHFVAAMGRYDAEYINYFTGISPRILSTSSLFYGNIESTVWTQARVEILYGPVHGNSYFLNEIKKLAQGIFTVSHIRHLYKRYTFQNVADHRAAILFPYAVLSYGITELYALGIPLFVPSAEFLVKSGVVWDLWIGSDAYCGKGAKFPQKHPLTRHLFSPEDQSPEAKQYWLQFADYFQWPHITFFSSLENLIEKLKTANFTEIHLKMVAENHIRKQNLIFQWNEIASQIETNREVPRKYLEAIQTLWNVSQLQFD